MADTLLSRPIVPVANPEDAKLTYERLRPRLPADSVPLFVNVIQKSGGGIDKAPLGRMRELGEEIFEHVGSLATEDGLTVETKQLYGTDVAEAIIEAGDEYDASAIVFTSRGGNKWIDLLSGGIRSTLVAEANIPVVVLPTDVDTDPN
ncbi:universal stress protein [Natronocalculus amylovorans]|uniref:Universal stress protein n=1 Tax=Natronocalculus amylovorans TaxID=2917812 RepID=A0AAE3FXA7_9EURY|nr:universal stress protein [Natronocalculus amylovorans]MCL9816379.1 universal stress protein [Natronocalculus amylovorans]